MKTDLDRVIIAIGEEYQHRVKPGSRHYVEVNIGEKAVRMGLTHVKQQFPSACAVVPLKDPAGGMKVRIDGRTFVRYREFPSGIALPDYVTRESGLAHRPFVPPESLILNFA